MNYFIGPADSWRDCNTGKGRSKRFAPRVERYALGFEYPLNLR